MRAILNLILVCILLTCQQYTAAQSYKLGKQKSSFDYQALYDNPPTMKNIDVAKKVAPSSVENETTTPVIKETVKLVVNEPVELKNRHQQLVQLYNNSQPIDDGNVFNIYYNLYKSFPRTTEDIEMLLKIQQVVMQYYSSKTTSYPDLEKQLKAVSSFSEQKNILLSYSK